MAHPFEIASVFLQVAWRHDQALALRLRAEEHASLAGSWCKVLALFTASFR
jgi:hypothetical protein